MNRRLVSCLMLILLALQSVAASALSLGDISAHDAHVMEHRDVTDGPPSGSCDCCDDDCMPDSVCATYCSVYFPASSLIVSFDVPTTNESIAFVAKSLPNPGYAPLNPPPIA